MIEDRLGEGEHRSITCSSIPPTGEGQAWLHDRGEVMARENFPDGRIRMTVRLSQDKAGQAAARFGKQFRVARRL